MDDLYARATCPLDSDTFELAAAIERAAARRPIRTEDDLDDALCVQAVCERLAADEPECAAAATDEGVEGEDEDPDPIREARFSSLLRPSGGDDEEGPTELDLQLCELAEIAATDEAAARPRRRAGEQGRARRTLKPEDRALLAQAGYHGRGTSPRA